MGVNVDDIVSFEMTCKFGYKNCEVTVKKINDVVDVRIICISEKGYILEKHKTFIIDHKEFNPGILNFISKANILLYKQLC